MNLKPHAITLVLLGLAPIAAVSQEAANRPAPAVNLAEFKTVETAIKATIAAAKPNATGQTGYLGISVAPDKRGRLVVGDVDTGSPAASAGIESGDILVRIAGKQFKTAEELREFLRAQAPGTAVKLTIEHARKAVDKDISLGAVSRPRKLSDEKPVLGVQIAEGTDEGARVIRVTRGSPADTAGVRTGDLLVKVDGVAVTEALRLDDTVGEKKAGMEMILTVKRTGITEKELEIKVTLAAAEPNPNQGDPGNDRRPRFSKDVYKLAIIPIEYPDVKHNEAVKLTDWEESMFSKGTYKDKNSVSGYPVYGSMNDHFIEQSVGQFHIEGKFFNWVEVSKNRADYSQGSGTGPLRNQLLTEALDKLITREGPNALDGFDGVVFIYGGNRFVTNRGGIYWPHRSTINHRGKRWAYFIVPEGGSRMLNISVMSHEFGHMLGLPDLYARPENPGSEGLGTWCLMSNQVGNGRPQHMSAWCKEQLGWLKPTVIDPTVKQKLILSPIEGSKTECFKVLIKPDGSEYLLLENRKKTGFDASLSAEGLLIWRVVGNRPILEEAHGVDGPTGPRVFLSSVPFPSPENSAFTPLTTPSSRSQLGGGLPVYITNIQRHADGRISFYVGYTFD